MRPTSLTLAIALLIAAAPAAAQTVDSPVPAHPICVDGKLIGLTLFVPRPGNVVIRIPLDVCDESKPAEKPPASAPPQQKRPARPAPALRTT